MFRKWNESTFLELRHTRSHCKIPEEENNKRGTETQHTRSTHTTHNHQFDKPFELCEIFTFYLDIEIVCAWEIYCIVLLRSHFEFCFFGVWCLVFGLLNTDNSVVSTCSCRLSVLPHHEHFLLLAISQLGWANRQRFPLNIIACGMKSKWSSSCKW